MKATIERATLLKCLSHVQSVVERRNTIPILSNVLIEASPSGSVRLMATDLDLQVVETMGAVSVDAPGAITVSAHLLFDIARKLPDGSQVSFEAAENRMTVKAGRSRFSLPTLPRDDFPVIVEGDLPTSFEIPARTLAERRLAWAVLAEPIEAEADAIRLDFRQSVAAEIEARIRAARTRQLLPELDARAAAPAIVGAVLEGLIGPLAPEPADAAAARQAVQETTLLALRALGVVDARARGLVAQVPLG